MWNLRFFLAWLEEFFDVMTLTQPAFGTFPHRDWVVHHGMGGVVFFHNNPLGFWTI